MRFKLLCLGKSKGSFDDLAGVYAKRINGYAQISVIEIPEVRYVKEPPAKDRERILAEEGARIAAKIDPRDHVVALDMRGRRLSSERFASYLQDQANRGISDFAFLIGGSLGLETSLKERADLCLSLSSFTLPHLLARVVLLEQVYRALTICRGEPYHK